MQELQINEEFKSLIPKLTAEEYEGLEASIIQEGCRDKIVTWKGYIIDGHNRYEICKKHSIAFECLEKDNFETEADVKLWIKNNQFHRKNLSEHEIKRLQKIRDALIKEKEVRNG